MVFGAGEPVVGVRCQHVVGPVAVFFPVRRVDHPGNMARAGEHKTMAEQRLMEERCGELLILHNPNNFTWCFLDEFSLPP